MNNIKAHFPILRRTELFYEFSDDEMQEALELLGAKSEQFEKNDKLILPYDPITRFGTVLYGIVQVSCDDVTGNRTIMATVTRGGIFAEALAFIGTEHSPVYAEAVSAATVLWIPIDRMREALDSDRPICRTLRDNFIRELSLRSLSMNDRLQILSKKNTEEKIIAFLTQQQKLRGSKSFDIPFDREALADYLAVDRSALSRRLSKMRDDGILRFHKNHFELLI